MPARNQPSNNPKGRPPLHTAITLINWGTGFKSKFGFFPGRDDLKAPHRQEYINKGYSMVHPTTIERVFHTWSNFRAQCGETPSKYTHSDIAERASISYLTAKYGLIENTSNTGVEDGWIGQEGIEIKASTLRDKTPGETRFRWMLHQREYSKVVDQMFLIGVDENADVIIEIHLKDKIDIQAIADNKQCLELTGSSLRKGVSRSVLWPFVVSYVPQV